MIQKRSVVVLLSGARHEMDCNSHPRRCQNHETIFSVIVSFGSITNGCAGLEPWQ